MSRYQVKFNHWEKGTTYGVVEAYSPEAKKYAKQGVAIVADALLPETYLVKDADLTDIPMEWSATNKDEYTRYVETEFEKAQALSDSLGDGVKVGKLFGIGVGDGTAWYVVTKVNKKTVNVEWRGFCADRWTDHYFGWGRKGIPLRDIEQYVGRHDGLKKLFSKAGA